MTQTTLGELSIGGGVYGIGASAVDFSADLPTYLRISDIRDDGTLNLSTRKSVADPRASDFMLHSHDIVFARTGNSTGRNYYYEPRDGEFAYAGFLIKFTLNPQKVNPRFIKYYAQSRPYWNWVASFNSGSTRGNINAKTYEAMPIDLPPREVQDGIVALCDSVFNKIHINQQTNDYLAEMCEAIAEDMSTDDTTTLADISSQITTKVSCEDSTLEDYVSTESLVPDKGGRQLASTLPSTGKVTVYRPGDTLISNIRPYFKKVWYADREGTCSGDVIVFRANDSTLAPYLYSVLRSDRFFEHVMAGAKGTKMPRGDKKQMMRYPVVNNCAAEGLNALASMLDQISAYNMENARLAALRDALLPKLMSGEIDVSAISTEELVM